MKRKWRFRLFLIRWLGRFGLAASYEERMKRYIFCLKEAENYLQSAAEGVLPRNTACHLATLALREGNRLWQCLW